MNRSLILASCGLAVQYTPSIPMHADRCTHECRSTTSDQSCHRGDRGCLHSHRYTTALLYMCLSLDGSRSAFDLHLDRSVFGMHRSCRGSVLYVHDAPLVGKHESCRFKVEDAWPFSDRAGSRYEEATNLTESRYFAIHASSQSP